MVAIGPADAAELTIKAKSGTVLTVKSGGSLRLQDANGRDLISTGTIATANGATILTLTHDPHERFTARATRARIMLAT